MRIDGITLALLDVPQDLVPEFNRWHEVDHQPEHLAKQDVALGRRYHASDAVRSAVGAVPSDITAGYPSYAVIYSLGGTTDFMDPDIRARWVDLDLELRRAGRFWKVGDPPKFSGQWRLRSALGSPQVLVQPVGIPYLPHRSVVLFLGRAQDGTRGQSLAWWDNTRRGDLLTLDGVLGIVSFDPIDPLPDDLVLHMLLCERPASDVLDHLLAADRMNRAMGRYPAHGGVYDEFAVLAYDRIVALDYDDLVPANEAAIAGKLIDSSSTEKGNWP